MKRFPSSLGLALSIALILSSAGIAAEAARSRPSPSSPPGVGALAPDFTLVDQNGRAVTLSAARGEKVVLVFYRGYW